MFGCRLFFRSLPCLAALIFLSTFGRAHAAPLFPDLVPLQVSPEGPYSVVTINSQPIYEVGDVAGTPGRFLYFDVPNSYTPNGAPVYVQVFYLDTGYGYVHVEYDTNVPGDDYREEEVVYNRRLFDTGEIHEMVCRLDDPGFQGSQDGGADFRIKLDLPTDRLRIYKVALWTSEPPSFAAHSAEPWKTPYSGPERTDISTTTLSGKVLCGYQGWFNTPHDGPSRGWVHWSNNSNQMTASDPHVEMWPDQSEYDPADLTSTKILNADSSYAKLYSSLRQGVVRRHFRWMRQYGIDGVFLSRFIAPADTDPDGFRANNIVLGHVRDSAHREGRVWAMMLDVSNNTTLQQVKDDWMYLVDHCGIKTDSRYLHQDGKPVLLLWGFGFTSRPQWSVANLVDILNWLHNDPTYGGIYVVGGVHGNWRTGNGSNGAFSYAAWSSAYAAFDGISPWSVNRYKTVAQVDAYTNWQNDLAVVTPPRIYMPTAYPGYSFLNGSNGADTNVISRAGGDFYWRQFYKQKTLGINTVFVGMFDEVDEATAIYKVTADSPPGVNNMVNYGAQPSDFYLKLTGMATKMMRGEITNTNTKPTTFPFPINGTADLNPSGLGYLEGSGYEVDVEQGPGTPTTQQITITNTGTDELTIYGLSFSGPNAADFSLLTPPAFPVVIPISGGQLFTIQFAPQSATRTLGLSATLTIETDEPGAEQRTLTLTGDAVPVALSGFQAE